MEEESLNTLKVVKHRHGDTVIYQDHEILYKQIGDNEPIQITEEEYEIDLLSTIDISPNFHTINATIFSIMSENNLYLRMKKFGNRIFKPRKKL